MECLHLSWLQLLASSSSPPAAGSVSCQLSPSPVLSEISQVSSIASMESTELWCLTFVVYVLTSISSGGMCCILSSDLIILHVLIVVLFDINSLQVTVLADLTYASKDIPFFHDQCSLRSLIFTQV